MPKTIMRAFKINEISAVDTPAQEGAKALILKRVINGDMAKKAVVTNAVDGHTHLIILSGHGGAQLTSGATEYDDTGHSHPWVVQEMLGEIIIGRAVDPTGLAHSHIAEVMSKAEPKDDEEDTKKPADLQDKTAGTNPEASDDDTGSTSVKNDEGASTMPDTENQVNTTDTVEELTKKLQRAEAIAELNDTEKAHFNSIDDMGKGDFLAKSADERTTEMDILSKAAADSDPVIYTNYKGLELRKSDGAAILSLAKSNDLLREQNIELAKASANATYAKRAEAELGNLPGSTETRIALLKSIDTIEDEGARASVIATLSAKNESFAPAHKMAGHEDGQVDKGLTAEQELDQMAETLSTEKGITKAAAYVQVLETEKGSALYTKSITSSKAR